VLSNLIENAIEHAGPTSPIDISARREFGGFEITVADRGPGIPKGAERSIFERFVRGPGTRGGGVGLGLAICQAVANAHGGSIVGENRSGGGAAFRVTLPVPPEPPTTESARFGALAAREEETWRTARHP
jgi:two-component system sensor histidine kinase KdpD